MRLRQSEAASEWLGIEDYMLETYPSHRRERLTIDAARLIGRAIIAAALIMREREES